ncbi:hypothetical protein SAMN04488012_11721 [Palleronia salina]|uniref:Hemolysin-type calcium-binding repeat-containing protein n=1 Tax=Palleronia salina TaxID=313368 RepID=A0A1M6LRC9_9RHOB|nr:hypothetical protein [Palleronia salina]SHJ73642.1 hypothetical protein SAMN04488012_11721 [Palleronia salina]
MGGDGNDTIEAASLRDLSYTTIFDGSAARNQTIIVGGAGIDQLVIASDLADVSAFRDSDGGIYLRDGSTDVPVVVHEVEQFVFDDQTVLLEDLDVSVPVIGTTGDDTLDGTDGPERIEGKDGDDLILPGSGLDTVDGGDGEDTVSFADAAGPIFFRLQPNETGDYFRFPVADGPDGNALDLSNIESFTGTGFDDTFQGTDGDNTILGLGGDDLLRGSRGADHFDGGDGVDTDRYLQGGALSASLMDGTGTGGEADGDSSTGVENLTGGHDDDLLEGDDGANVLLGDTTESLYFDVRGAGWDTLIGHGGDDTLDGGTYRSDYSGSGSTADVAVYAGPRARYDITGTANDGSSAMTVADSAPGGDGTDTLFNIGSPVFSDGVMVMATPRSAPLNMPTTEEDDTIYGSAVYVQDFML